jgi:negative regulator of sigma-B (phosphoserine phosphatase)
MALKLQYDWLNRPCQGETQSGDGVFVQPLESGLFCCLYDVLGHGDQAHLLVEEIKTMLTREATADLLQLITSLHRQLQRSRGAALGLCYIDTNRALLHYCGVGNTCLRIFAAQEHSLVSQNGTLGHFLGRPLQQQQQLHTGDIVMMHSDGMHCHFQLKDYPMLKLDSPQTAAATLMDRFGKKYDDCSCLIVRCEDD